MWCTIYATFWALWTHKPTIKLTRTLGKLLSRYVHQYQHCPELAWAWEFALWGSMQPTSGAGNGVCETSAQGFAKHQATSIAMNGGMLHMQGVGVEEPLLPS